MFRRLPADAEQITLIDRDAARAAQLAREKNARASDAISAASDADMLLFVLPAEAIPDAMTAAAACAKHGATLVNMATNGRIPDELPGRYPALTFVDAKIIGHAGAMAQGANGIVVAGTADARVLCEVRAALCGIGSVVCGDASLVPSINTIGSAEGIRAAVNVKKQLAAYGVPKAWEEAAILTVCAGTMRAYVEDDLGGFGRALAEKLEAE